MSLMAKCDKCGLIDRVVPKYSIDDSPLSGLVEVGYVNIKGYKSPKPDFVGCESYKKLHLCPLCKRNFDCTIMTFFGWNDQKVEIFFLSFVSQQYIQKRIAEHESQFGKQLPSQGGTN